jgi:hypothetical protein
MTTSRQARRRRRRYYQTLASEHQRNRVQARVEPVHGVDDLYAKRVAWMAIVVFVLVAIVLAATL